MLTRFSTPALLGLGLGFSLLLSTFGRPGKAPDPDFTISTAAAPPGDTALAPGKKLEVTGAFFAYCAFDEECGDSRILQIGKSPTQFVIDTAADKSLKGVTIDFTVELLTQEGKSIFDAAFSLEHEHIPRQRTRLLYKKQPPVLGKLAPGKYIYRVAVQTADGTQVSEWKRVIEARK